MNKYILLVGVSVILSGCTNFQFRYDATHEKVCLGKDALIAAAMAANDIRVVNAIDTYCAPLPVKGL